MFRTNPTFVVSVLVCLFSNHAVFVHSQNAACDTNRCIRVGSTNLKYNTCGATCTTLTCTDLARCTAANNDECGQDACVSAPYLEARALNEGFEFCDPCCASYAVCIQQYNDDNSKGFLCFSAFASADVLNKGKTLIKDLQVGDEVLTASGGYKQVYTIAHTNPDKAAEFLQIYTSATSPLELTKDHFVFLHNKHDPIPAGEVKVGDALQSVGEQPALVTKISSVTRNGLWNPVTEDGTIVVDGIVTSTYTALDVNSNGDHHSIYLEMGGFKIMAQHDFFHLLMTPFRALCVFTSSSFCEVAENEEFTSYSQLGLKVFGVSKQLPPMIQNLLAIGAIVTGGFLYLILTNPWTVATLSISGMYYYYYTTMMASTRKLN